MIKNAYDLAIGFMDCFVQTACCLQKGNECVIEADWKNKKS